MRRNLGRCTPAVLLVALFATACGGGADTDSSQGSAGDGSGTTITVGGVGQLTDFAGLDAGFKARIDRANRDGEIDGVTIDFIGVQDDKGDSTSNISIVRQLVQQDEVFAVAPIASAAFLPQASDFLKQQTTPFIGWGVLSSFCANEYGFGFNGCLVDQPTVSTGIVAPMYDVVDQQPEDVTFGLLSNDNATGRSGNPLYVAVIDALGGQVVFDQATVPGAGKTIDYAPYAQKVMDADPDVLIMGTDFTSTIGMAAALDAAGFKGKQVSFVTYAPGLLEAQPETAAALEGQYVNVQIPPEEEGSEAVEQIAADLEASGAKPDISFGTSLGYWQADVFVQMLAAAAGDDLTKESFVEKVNSGFTYSSDLAGGIGDVSFPAAHTEAVPCSALLQVKDGAYTSAVPFQCYENIPLKN